MTETAAPAAPVVPEAIEQALVDADAEFQRLDDALAVLSDGDLHRAHRDGGWTVSQTCSHINVCTVMWLGDLARLAADPDLTFFFREEIGHDLTGYPPPTVDLARGQLTSTRRSMGTGFRAVDSELLARVVEIPDLGTMSVEEWFPLIIGHAASHVGQAAEIMRDREFGPEGI